MFLRILLISLLLSGSLLQAQNPVYEKVTSLLKKNYPEVDLNNKVLSYNAWSLNDESARAFNQELDKVTNIYQSAKLKGGKNGMIGVSIVLDGADATANTTLRYDGVQYLLQLNAADLHDLFPGAPLRATFDAEGNEIGRNTADGQLFQFINGLITR